MSKNTPIAKRISFQPVTEADFEELLALRVAAMRESLERLGRFDPQRARARLQNSFYPEHTRFIVLDAERIGFYTLRPTEAGLHLDHLYIHPDYQSQGVGSFVIQKITQEADVAGKSIRLGALKGSASNRFYQRHGFVQETEEEWDINYVRA
ncbi:MAG: N-acetyltransferase [Verrucomicrobiaceae bacterium]|nr:MAG: N-acetyltransferase [Verrucomicrobiaceae bacterium]